MAAALTCASIRARSSAATSPISSMASTKKRRPSSVGSRPALVCGAKIEARRLEVRHDVAHRGRRQGDRQDARQVARADRLTRGEIAFDDLPKNLAGAVVQFRDGAEFGGRGRLARHGHAGAALGSGWRLCAGSATVRQPSAGHTSLLSACGRREGRAPWRSLEGRRCSVIGYLMRSSLRSLAPLLALLLTASAPRAANPSTSTASSPASRAAAAARRPSRNF